MIMVTNAELKTISSKLTSNNLNTSNNDKRV